MASQPPAATATDSPPLRVLSLDGGGVRGYSMLVILQELMHLTFVNIHGRPPRREEIPKPCDHFDLIVGTGTGGLIGLMLGRLRLDIETCKNVYVRMTKLVFETDKTIAGIPYRSTLFKASKLEEAIQACVRQHTIYANEGSDEPGATVRQPIASPTLSPSVTLSPAIHGGPSPYRSASNASRYSDIGRPIRSLDIEGGNQDALLYDRRPNKTKTAVTAVYKGTPSNGSSVLLRSYDSRKEPAPEFDCTIWQAGRATSATAVAFKPVRIGQSVFVDEGAGKYNPAPQALDEAVLNEWPGRDVAVFVSIGTGIRASSVGGRGNTGWEDFLAAKSFSEFAEARSRIIEKIKECEVIHQEMLSRHLARRGVPVDNYVRFNVEIGVGQFGMNEWSRLGDISTLTRQYLSRPEVHANAERAASKLANVDRLRRRHRRIGSHQTESVSVSTPHLGAVELPGSPVMSHAPAPFAPNNYSSGLIPVNPPVPPKTPHSVSTHHRRMSSPSRPHPAPPSSFRPGRSPGRAPSTTSSAFRSDSGSRYSSDQPHSSGQSPSSRPSPFMLNPNLLRHGSLGHGSNASETYTASTSRMTSSPPPPPPQPLVPPPPPPPPPIPPKTAHPDLYSRVDGQSRDALSHTNSIRHHLPVPDQGVTMNRLRSRSDCSGRPVPLPPRPPPASSSPPLPKPPAPLSFKKHNVDAAPPSASASASSNYKTSLNWGSPSPFPAGPPPAVDFSLMPRYGIPPTQ